MVFFQISIIELNHIFSFIYSDKNDKNDMEEVKKRVKKEDMELKLIADKLDAIIALLKQIYHIDG